MTMRQLLKRSSLQAPEASSHTGKWSRYQESGAALCRRYSLDRACRGLAAARIELAALLDQYDLYCKQEETIMANVLQILEKIPGTKQMLGIPGISSPVSWRRLAILNSYDHGQQIIRLAGLHLTENSSGKRKGKTHNYDNGSTGEAEDYNP